MTQEAVAMLEDSWKRDRWKGVERSYTAEDVVRLRGSVSILGKCRVFFCKNWVKRSKKRTISVDFE